MASGHPLELNQAVPGGRIEVFAIRDDDYPGGWFYRFQYYHPDNGDILRYDNAHEDSELGWHHRHCRLEGDREIPFLGIVPHVSRFLRDIETLSHATENSHD